MRKPEGLFFLTWGIATFFTSLIVTYLTVVHRVSFVGALWALVPVFGLTGTYVLVRYYKGHYVIFGEYRRVVAALWMFTGPAIGLVGFDSPTPLVAKTVLLGVGIAITGRLVRHCRTMLIGIITSFFSIALYQFPVLYQPIVFGITTLIAMSVPGLLFIFSPANRAEGTQSITQDAQ